MAVRFGIVGCGTIGPFHIKGIKANENAELAAVCDIIPEKAKKIADEEDVPYYSSMDEMLRAEKLDVVNLCTPSSLHAEQAVLAASCGVNVLTEKPMAVTLADCDRMIAAADKAGIKLGCIFQRRVTEPFRSIKDWVEGGVIGRPLLGDMYCKYYRAQDYYDSAGWRGTVQFDGGGAMMNQSIHIVDLIRWYFGPVKTVFGFARTLARSIEVEDTCVACLEFASGAVGVIEGTTSVFPPTIPHRIELHGDKGSILIEGESLSRFEVEGENGEVIDRLEAPVGDVQAITNPTDIMVDGHIVQIGDIARCVTEGGDPVVSGVEAREAVRLILAIYESSETGKPVSLL